MRMTKKVTAMALASMMALSLAGCGSSSTTATTAAATEAATTAAAAASEAATTAAETTAAETTAAEAKAEESEAAAEVTFGGNRTEEDIDWQYVDGKDAVAAVGSDDVQFLDVRDDDTYAQGHLKGSLQCGLKEFEDADAQKAMYELAQTMDSSKPVYILCYSGNKCAKTAIAVMKDAGFDTNELFIIKDGAKDKDVAAALVTE